MIDFLERILLNTGNYNGRNFLNSIDMSKSESGISIGIRFNFDEPEKRFIDTDHTRVKYL